jgi:hypothetical protein
MISERWGLGLASLSAAIIGELQDASMLKKVQSIPPKLLEPMLKLIAANPRSRSVMRAICWTPMHILCFACTLCLAVVRCPRLVEGKNKS